MSVSVKECWFVIRECGWCWSSAGRVVVRVRHVGCVFVGVCSRFGVL